ncbi:hypothetical protein [Paremcibacter congregatus]|uniref:Shikimate kinase n=1 Tax=Paremcibacter congregatus TaxID=2043170 RepID=A0A2G4YUU5_9PROT|nr:hypothetical protein [Paremcibacter congregatus]PHZ85226.1 hypothetical protein CRD36_07400 [Paremcibacter congregatus]QDE27841.1 hypothetical protein FIV45_11435 [Paremcibacter congregatus]
MSVVPQDPVVRERLYNLFKYSIYLLLMWNTYLFFQQDWASSSHTFRQGVPLPDIIAAFTDSIDTMNWVILLLLFELETWVLSDEVLKKKSLKWGLLAVRGLCYSLIVYAFYGFWAKMMLFYGVTSFPVEDMCRLVDGQMAFVAGLDNYVLLTNENCRQLNGLKLFELTTPNLIVDADTLSATRGLAWVDVINSGTWLGVVVILEVDVWFQTRGLLEGMVLKISKLIKAVFYSTLLGCAVYWGLLGGFLDFWDAFLWLLAFAFIEMNLFQWQQETKEQDAKVQKMTV